MYLEILYIGICHPNFRNIKFTENYIHLEDETGRIQYEQYANICWNFCESIYDKGDDELLKTWQVVIDTEKKMHYKWFEQLDNFRKF